MTTRILAACLFLCSACGTELNVNAAPIASDHAALAATGSGIGDAVVKRINAYLRKNDIEIDDKKVSLTEDELDALRNELNQIESPIDVADILRVRETGVLSVFDVSGEYPDRPFDVLVALLNGDIKKIVVEEDIRALREEILANYFEDAAFTFRYLVEVDTSTFAGMISYWRMMDLVNFEIGPSIDQDDVDAMKSFEKFFAGNKTNIAVLRQIQADSIGFGDKKAKDEFEKWVTDLEAGITP